MDARVPAAPPNADACPASLNFRASPADDVSQRGARACVHARTRYSPQPDDLIVTRFPVLARALACAVILSAVLAGSAIGAQPGGSLHASGTVVAVGWSSFTVPAGARPG